jgi:superfamily II DNA helicase RecQ
MLEGVTISLLAIDEAHCVAEWGPSFRPGECKDTFRSLSACSYLCLTIETEYLKVARFAKEINAERVLALTATATRSVEKAICDGFDINEAEGVFRTPVYRNK